MNVLVFKTSVERKSDIRKLKKCLDQLVLGKWNFDLEDCDNILRVEYASKSLAAQVVAKLTARGYFCEEL